LRTTDPRVLVATNAVVGAGFGAVLLIAPTVLAKLLGLHLDPTAALMARLYGAELFGFGVTTWSARKSMPVPSGVVYGHIGNETLTAIALCAATANGLGNILLPILAIVPAIFSIGYLVLAIAAHRRTATSAGVM
jgi:hypothetical protein